MDKSVGELDRLTRILPLLGKSWIEQGIVPAEGEVVIERQFEAGQSNPTYLLKAGKRRIVLRKQPDGLLAARAHDVVREHAIMRALFESGFAVPRPLLSVEKANDLGTNYFLMEYVPGQVHSDASLPGADPQARESIYLAMADALADLHNLKPEVLAIAGVRPKPDFVRRQIELWTGLYTSAQTEHDDRIASVSQWLLDNLPITDATTIVHGDYRIENIIWDGASLAAILDWELTSIGDPQTDLGYCCIWYHLPHAVLGGLADLDLGKLGIPEEGQFIERYARRRKLTDVANHSYFLAFAFYRLAAILQGVYRRALDGSSASPHALTRGRAALACLERAVYFASGSSRLSRP